MIVKWTTNDLKTVLTAIWDPVATAQGFSFWKDGVRVSYTMDGARTSARFGLDGKPHIFEVYALGKLDHATTAYPLPSTPPPPPAVTVGARTRPQGALTDRTTSDFRYGLNSGTVSGIHIHDTPDYGFGVMGYWGSGAPTPATGTVTISDVVAERVGTTPPHMNGQGEAGLWYGQQVDARRCVGHGTWMGGWTGAQCRDSLIQDHTFAVLNADGTLGKLPGVGLYIEHATRRLVIEYCTIKAKGTGINWEWTYSDGGSLSSWLKKEYPDYPTGLAGSLDITIRYCDIESDTVGVFLDGGACGLTMHHCKITAPVGVKRNTVLAMPSKPHQIDYSTIEFHGQTLEQTHSNPMGTP